ncbi:acetyl-CoA hydrolase/transferase C-terminal domain-containing protein [Pseudomonas sp. 10B1]|uniref:acetyl-CoA hydrolase/transferase C-terminal domain-containing protein n=1 Tax=unclassified Pseudomonas TaxID=196821 RepID=UPI002AB51043|nr:MULTISPECIES: acetyl-CoA hydrolase/transferase C-terminal domain-containing protein [unclassified Pseudomonas]MDY7562727.1 acetyl-CoA hydrolase/transferase C-terminal domain-containing protein [Pseudomonas sp. AB6]MEA9977409.1 acetyl-CoA hydrolase/transferase C-terminal domain-containing protein [Pseudomonas sp. RTS4]MEA9996919.1 acetyl-CoA hydrolase/transferase C-terminal domain-containing protein [Pseudomonas sp. AA4]MEB0089160.1 acetyl-CoA hydrolase/transferase C-terminal domain-containin
MPQSCSIQHAVDQVLEQLPAHIHMGLPLGLGKPNLFVNALYARVRQLPERRLTIYTALCLGRPDLGDGLQERFLEPFVARVFGDYPELDFLADLHRDRLPPNIRVEQFFMLPGSLLNSHSAQQDYVSSNYSHAARDINANGLNLVAQLVARDPARSGRLSLSCNSDVTLDLLPMIAKRRAAGETILLLGHVHADLPYMPGDSELDVDDFDLLIENEDHSTLFSTPNMPVGFQDHFIGLHTSTLVRDGGTLQIGIGSMGDALTAALLARQADNGAYRALLDELDATSWQTLIQREGGLQPFAQGLYGCSEMFVNGLLVLVDAGIVRRRVYADAAVQRQAIAGTLDESLRSDGVVVHGGFFLGPNSFYQRLREFSLEQMGRFNMTAISYINELYGNEELKRLQRRDARFINSAFKVTLLGAAIADQLEDGRVVSGVGGQYNFVAQAHALEGARSVLMLRSWRESGGDVSSSIVWTYGHATIPRHLRDIVVTEYGIADLRGKTDVKVIEALLNISDSRFQTKLIEQAQKVGKLPADFQLDPRFTENTPERLQALQARYEQLFTEYPLGCDFNTEEKDLLRALNWLKSKFNLTEILQLGKATFDAPEPSAYPAHLERMQLDNPQGLKQELFQRLVLAGLQATAQPLNKGP